MLHFISINMVSFKSKTTKPNEIWTISWYKINLHKIIEYSFFATCSHQTCAINSLHTIFPRNPAKARLYFKAQFGMMTIRGWLNSKGGVNRDRHSSCMHTPPQCVYVRIMHVRICTCITISISTFIMSWQEHISRVAWFRCAATFWANTAYYY